MLRIIKFLLFIATSLLYAQNHRFIYEVKYKKDSTENIFTHEYYHLDIEKEKVFYYNRDYFVADSLISAGVPPNIKNAPNESNFLISNDSAQTFAEYETLGFSMVKLISAPSQIWSLEKETKSFLGFLAQKATCEWGGRKWTAWFCSQLIFNLGPHKFHGLPGLIVELYDNKNNYLFNLLKSESLAISSKNSFLEFSVANAILVTRDKYKRIKNSFYADPFAYVSNSSINLSEENNIILSNGIVVDKDNIKEMSKVYQSMIKKYNNPIEISQAIKYP